MVCDQRMVNHIAMFHRYMLNTSSPLDSSRFTNQKLFHNSTFDMNRFPLPQGRLPGGPPGTPGTNTVGLSANLK